MKHSQQIQELNNQNQQIQKLQNLATFILIVIIVLNLAALTFFKYINWLLINTNILLNAFGLPLLLNHVTIILPLGISFFTFQNISFQIDAYRKKIQQISSYMDYSLYIAFFPQLIAGPIVRAHRILPQFQRLPNLQNIYLSDALARILVGLVKKAFIANILSTSFADPIFLAPSSYSSLELLLAAYAYSAVIYCDFSGYSDLAIGLGLLCGIRLMENFHRPYAANSLQNFWRGWHISLSTWLRDYLYIPLGGNRKGSHYINIIITMLLGGLWHGASWTFLVWGALHGIAISIEHYFKKKLAVRNGFQTKFKAKLHSLLGWLYSFHFITLTWILFRAPNFSVAGNYFKKLFSMNFSHAGSITNIVLLTIAIGILPQIVCSRSTTWLTKLFDSLPLIAQILIFAIGVALIQIVLPEGIAPFIYYQF